MPYSTHYELYIQAENLKYKSDFTHISLKTDNIGDHIDQSPRLLSKGTSSVTFELPELDRRLQYYEVTVVAQDFDTSIKVDPTIMKNKKISDHLCQQYGHTWISQTLKVRLSLS